MVRLAVRCCATLLFAGLASFRADAARVSPMVVNVAPSGSAAAVRLELTNPDEVSFPAEVRMFRGDISETGELALEPADDDFLVFPTQLVVPPRSQQILRLQYVGSPQLGESQIYYAAIKQVPIAMTGPESKVQLIVNFNVLVNVVPDGSRPDPQVEILNAEKRGDVDGVEVRVVNKGTRYMTAGTLAWQINGTAVDGSAVELRKTPVEMAKIVGVGVVAPGKARRFFLPTDKPLNPSTVRVTLAQ